MVVAFRANVREVRADLEELVGKWARKERELVGKAGEIEGVGKKVISHYDTQLTRVNQAYESAIKALHSRRNEHISQLKQQLSTQMRHLDSTKSRLQAAIDQTVRQTEKLRSALSSLDCSAYQDISNLLKMAALEGKKQEEVLIEPVLASFREGIRVTDLSSVQVEVGGKRQEVEARRPHLPLQLEDFQTSSVYAESAGSFTCRHKSDSKTEIELLELINSKSPRVNPATDDRGRPITRRPASKGKPAARKLSNSV